MLFSQENHCKDKKPFPSQWLSKKKIKKISEQKHTHTNIQFTVIIKQQFILNVSLGIIVQWGEGCVSNLKQ
jgi:hypothetical protein